MLFWTWSGRSPSVTIYEIRILPFGFKKTMEIYVEDPIMVEEINQILSYSDKEIQTNRIHIDYDPKTETCNTCGSKYTFQSAKMSKSLGNTLDPREITDEFGSDTARLFIMHAANPEKEIEWSDSGVATEHKIIRKMWNFIL